MKESYYQIISVGSFLLATFLIALIKSISMHTILQGITATAIGAFGYISFLIPIARINVLSGYQLLGKPE